MKITIELEDQQLEDLGVTKADLRKHTANMVRDALAEFSVNRNHAGENLEYARSYVHSRYFGSVAYGTEGAKERKAQSTHNRCKLAALVASGQLIIEETS